MRHSLYFVPSPRERFQSTHPTRGCDISSFHRLTIANYFNPRTPRGGATCYLQYFLQPKEFQSTHPTRGCDHDFAFFGRINIISIHAPHEGVRRWISRKDKAEGDGIFQSTHPTRGCDQMRYIPESKVPSFQSTHPTRGCDQRVNDWQA